jgi:hypothetical protein
VTRLRYSEGMFRALRLCLVGLLVLTLPLKGLAAAGWMMGCAAGHGQPAASAGAQGHDHAAHQHADAHAETDGGAATIDCSHCAPCSMVAAPSAPGIALPALPSAGSGHALSDGRHASADSDVPLRPPRSALA